MKLLTEISRTVLKGSESGKANPVEGLDVLAADYLPRVAGSVQITCTCWVGCKVTCNQIITSNAAILFTAELNTFPNVVGRVPGIVGHCMT